MQKFYATRRAVLLLITFLVMGSIGLYSCKPRSTSLLRSQENPQTEGAARIADISLMFYYFRSSPLLFHNTAPVFSALWSYAKDTRYIDAAWLAAETLLFIVFSSDPELAASLSDDKKTFSYHEIEIEGRKVDRTEVVEEMFQSLETIDPSLHVEPCSHQAQQCTSFMGCLTKIRHFAALSQAPFITSKDFARVEDNLAKIEADAVCLPTEGQKDLVVWQAKLAKGWAHLVADTQIASSLKVGYWGNLSRESDQIIRAQLNEVLPQLKKKYFMDGGAYRILNDDAVRSAFMPDHAELVERLVLSESMGTDPAYLESLRTAVDVSQGVMDDIQGTLKETLASAVKLQYLHAGSLTLDKGQWFECLASRSRELASSAVFTLEFLPLGGYLYPANMIRSIPGCPNEPLTPNEALNILGLDSFFISNQVHSAFRNIYAKVYGQVVEDTKKFRVKFAHDAFENPAGPHPKAPKLDYVRETVKNINDTLPGMLQGQSVDPRLMASEEAIARKVRGFHSLHYQFSLIQNQVIENTRKILHYESIAEQDMFYSKPGKKEEFVRLYSEEEYQKRLDGYIRPAKAIVGSSNAGGTGYAPVSSGVHARDLPYRLSESEWKSIQSRMGTEAEAIKYVENKFNEAKNNLMWLRVAMVPEGLRFACYKKLFSAGDPSFVFNQSGGGSDFLKDLSIQGGYFGCLKNVIGTKREGDFFGANCPGGAFQSRFDGGVDLNQLCGNDQNTNDFLLRQKAQCWVTAQTNYQSCNTVTNQLFSEVVMTALLAPIGMGSFKLAGKVTDGLLSMVSKNLAERRLGALIAQNLSKSYSYESLRLMGVLVPFAERAGIGVFRAMIAGTMMTLQNKIVMLAMGQLPYDPSTSSTKNAMMLGKELMSNAVFMSLGPMFDGVARSFAVKSVARMQRSVKSAQENLNRLRELKASGEFVRMGAVTWAQSEEYLLRSMYLKYSYNVQWVAEEAMFAPVDLFVMNRLAAFERWLLDMPRYEQTQEGWWEWLGYNVKGVLAFRRKTLPRLAQGLRNDATAYNQAADLIAQGRTMEEFTTYRRQALMHPSQRRSAEEYLKQEHDLFALVGYYQYRGTSHITRPPTYEELQAAYSKLVGEFHVSLIKDRAENSELPVYEMQDFYLITKRAKEAIEALRDPKAIEENFERLRRAGDLSRGRAQEPLDKEVEELIYALSPDGGTTQKEKLERYERFKKRFEPDSRDSDEMAKNKMRLRQSLDQAARAVGLDVSSAP